VSGDLPTAKPILRSDFVLAAIEAEMRGDALTPEQRRALQAFELAGDFVPCSDDALMPR